MTQRDQILAHLLSGRSITPAEALIEYGTMRLAAHIHAIKPRVSSYWKIVTHRKKSVSGKPYAQYMAVPLNTPSTRKGRN